MRKRRIISLAFVVMLFFSLTAFTAPFKSAKTTNILGTQLSLQAKVTCNHEYEVARTGDWTLISSEPYFHYATINKYERTVTYRCKKCGATKTTKETKRTVSYLYGLIEVDINN